MLSSLCAATGAIVQWYQTPPSKVEDMTGEFDSPKLILCLCQLPSEKIETRLSPIAYPQVKYSPQSHLFM